MQSLDNVVVSDAKSCQEFGEFQGITAKLPECHLLGVEH
jgi:hypothetical protein